MQRRFLGWQRPALRAAAEFLRQEYAVLGQWDLSRAIVVVPGRRAGRRLLEVLVQLAEEAGLALAPPEILTEGDLPERLYHPQRPLASRLTQQLAWARVLAEAPPDVLRRIVPAPPAPHDFPRWLELGDLLRRQHAELAADGLAFADVARRGAELPGFAEEPRWEALARVQDAYHRLLDSLDLWDAQTARLVAIDRREPQLDCDLFLLGAVDLNIAVRRMLDQVASRVTALVIAPQELANHFDEHGCVLAGAWREREAPLDDAQLRQVEGPADQAEEVARVLAGLAGKFRAEQITIGVPDETLVPQLARQLEQGGLTTRWVAGKPLAETGPYRLWAALADYAATRHSDDFAQLVRHPDLYDWLAARLPRRPDAELLTQLDQYLATHLVARLGSPWLGPAARHDLIAHAHAAIEAELLPGAGEPRSLAEWAPRLAAALTAVYGGRRLDRQVPRDHAILAACEKLLAALHTLAAAPAALAPPLPLAEALQLALREVGRDVLPPPATEEAVELLGWLELPLDDAPALVVTSFNEGFVPKSAPADSFLPNRLRQKLGLMDDDRRYARDAYAVSVIAASRPGTQFIFARRGAEQQPLAPSRVVFAASPETVARRALRFFDEPAAAAPRRPLVGDDAPPAESAFFVPRPRRRPAPEPREAVRLSVSKFKAFLACPYRYYLRHVLQLEAVSARAEELDGGAFGELLHAVLAQFAADPALRDLAHPGPLREALSELLDREALARFGRAQRRGAVSVQVEQLRLRLNQFADWQAQRSSDGWRMIYAEGTEQLESPLAIDGAPCLLRGRIDRIDRHLMTGRVQVLDYKTADKGLPPEAAHRKKRSEWIDLQLPLYRHLLSAATLFDRGRLDCELYDERVELGYILLPNDPSAIGASLAEWSAAELRSADETAQSIIRRIRQEEFWPPLDAPRYDDFAAICQNRLLVRRWEAEEAAA